jgi:hypothetical protein
MTNYTSISPSGIAPNSASGSPTVRVDCIGGMDTGMQWNSAANSGVSRAPGWPPAFPLMIGATRWGVGPCLRVSGCRGRVRPTAGQNSVLRSSARLRPISSRITAVRHGDDHLSRPAASPGGIYNSCCKAQSAGNSALMPAGIKLDRGPLGIFHNCGKAQTGAARDLQRPL